MDSTLSDPLVGRLLEGRYAVESFIAHGGMASVYLATDTRLDRRVAVKVLHAHLAGDQETLARFQREARAAARLATIATCLAASPAQAFDYQEHSRITYAGMSLFATDMASVKAAATGKLALVESRIEELGRVRDALQLLVDACPGHGALSECPIMAALSGKQEPTP